MSSPGADVVRQDAAAPTTTAAPTAATGTAALPINWSLAVATGTRLVPPGPAVSPEEAALEVARLRAGARLGEEHVRALTGLGAGLPVPEADVVDRPDWIRGAVNGIAELTATVRLPARTGPTAVVADAVGAVTATSAGVQMGALMAFLGSRVLGQYDPFGGRRSGAELDPPGGRRSGAELDPPGGRRSGAEGAGRLLLVAPNVAAARQALRVDADDFALWVCLHEATHRLQFTAVPWLREHFRDEVGTFASGLDRSASRTLERLPEVLRAARTERPADGFALLELLQSPEQRAVLDRLLALTTLLEGHAEHVMDEVGPEVVPSVAVIRQRFSARRRGGGFVDRLLRTVLGLDAKVRQYEQGRVFVDAVVARVGMEGFNQVWTSPETLPRRAEITEPDTWIARVVG